MTEAEDGCDLLKAMDISLFLLVFKMWFDFLHQSKKKSKTGPWSLSPSSWRLTKAVSSADLIKCLLGKVLVHEFVYKIKCRGYKTHPCGEPVDVVIVSERKEPATGKKVIIKWLVLASISAILVWDFGFSRCVCKSVKIASSTPLEAW